MRHRFNPSRNPDAYQDGEAVEYKNFWAEESHPNSSFSRDLYEEKIMAKPHWYFARFSENYVIERVWYMRATKVLDFVREKMNSTTSNRSNPTINFSESWLERDAEVVNIPRCSSSGRLIRRIRLVARLGDWMSPSQRILRRGRLKEMIMARKLGHDVVPIQGGADATDNQGRNYEYLAALEENGIFQQAHLSEESIYRITRNECYFCGYFSDSITLIRIYRVEIEDILEFIDHRRPFPEGQQNNLNLGISHVEDVGRVVWGRSSDSNSDET